MFSYLSWYRNFRVMSEIKMLACWGFRLIHIPGAVAGEVADKCCDYSKILQRFQDLLVLVSPQSSSRTGWFSHYRFRDCMALKEGLSPFILRQQSSPQIWHCWSFNDWLLVKSTTATMILGKFFGAAIWFRRLKSLISLILRLPETWWLFSLSQLTRYSWYHWYFRLK